jgi:hypothetical protein
LKRRHRLEDVTLVYMLATRSALRARQLAVIILSITMLPVSETGTAAETH